MRPMVETERAHAEAAAERVVEHWRKLGWDVKAWAEAVVFQRPAGTHHGACRVWTVRSDMVGGHPVRRIEG